MSGFVSIDLGREPAPDETTVCKFRHLLEKHKLGEQLLKAVNRHLHEHGIKISKGTIVDASIISAPSSTKNKEGQRDPEMHQTSKGKQWYFGMNVAICAPARSGIRFVKSSYTKKQYERFLLEQFLAASNISAHVIDDTGEAPDFIVRTENRRKLVHWRVRRVSTSSA